MFHLFSVLSNEMDCEKVLFCTFRCIYFTKLFNAIPGFKCVLNVDAGIVERIRVFCFKKNVMLINKICILLFNKLIKRTCTVCFSW